MGKSMAARKAAMGGSYEPDGHCCIRGCDRELWGHEFCRQHYQAWRKNGHPLHFFTRPVQISRAKSNSVEYKTWHSAKQRCTKPDNRQFSYYGGRGITMCDRWLNSFEAFFADMGARPPGLTLDRINVNGNYEPGNCRWATMAQQNRNTRATVLNPEIVADAKARRIAGESIASIARFHDVSYYALVQMLAGSSWVDIEPRGSA